MSNKLSNNWWTSRKLNLFSYKFSSSPNSTVTCLLSGHSPPKGPFWASWRVVNTDASEVEISIYIILVHCISHTQKTADPTILQTSFLEASSKSWDNPDDIFRAGFSDSKATDVIQTLFRRFWLILPMNWPSCVKLADCSLKQNHQYRRFKSNSFHYIRDTNWANTHTITGLKVFTRNRSNSSVKHQVNILFLRITLAWRPTVVTSYFFPFVWDVMLQQGEEDRCKPQNLTTWRTQFTICQKIRRMDCKTLNHLITEGFNGLTVLKMQHNLFLNASYQSFGERREVNSSDGAVR